MSAALTVILALAATAGPEPFRGVEAPREAAAPAGETAPPTRGPPEPTGATDGVAGGVLGLWYWLIPGLSVLAAVHALKTGRGWHWLWIIMFFPVLGALAYLFVEVLPGRHRHASGSAIGDVLDRIHPGREIRRLQRQLELSDTVENRRALARAHLHAGQALKAVQVCEECLQGAFADDPEVLLDLGEFLVHCGRSEEALAKLDALAAESPRHYPKQRDLFRAMALEGLGRKDEARATYQRIADTFDGEEARFRLAALLEANGELQKARAVYARILKASEGYSRHWKRLQREWISGARRALDRLKPPGA